LIVTAAIADHISRLQQRVTDSEAEVSRLQSTIDEMRQDADQQIDAAVYAEQQQAHHNLAKQLESVTQQR